MCEMSDVIYVNESRHKYERVRDTEIPPSGSHVTYMKASCHIRQWVTSPRYISAGVRHVTCVNESFHVCELVRSKVKEEWESVGCERGVGECGV